MAQLTSQEYWNTVGSKKDFEDPLYLDKLIPYITHDSMIVEYGCGYGRLLHYLNEHGYTSLQGFDFAPNMIERGKQVHPELKLEMLKTSGNVPCASESVDAVILSTVLCCMVDVTEQKKLIEELFRILKHNGVLYIADFLICDHDCYKEKYQQGLQKYGRWGAYTTSEHLAVCHLSSQSVFELLHKFDIQWFEQFTFKTMNHNPARTFHCIAQKK